MAFSEDIKEELLTRLANGESQRAISEDPRMPSHETVRLWLRSDETFLARYARAREDQADALADKAMIIAAEAKPETVNVARLQVDTIKWMAGKLRPKVYGDKVDVTAAVGLTINIPPDTRKL